jgi:hypothetical protein
MISNVSNNKKLPVKRLSFSFTDTKSEDEFLDLLRGSSVKQIRIAFLLGVALYMIFALLDEYFLPHSAQKILYIRIIVSSIFLIAFAVTFSKTLYKYSQLILFTLILISVGGIIMMILISDSSGRSSEGDIFGEDKIINAFYKVADKSTTEILNHFELVKNHWSKGLQQKDDITFLIFKMKNNNSK